MKTLSLTLCLALMAIVAKGQDFNVKTEELWAQRDGLRIYGQLYRPEGKIGRLPLVILSHGYSRQIEECDPYARQLARKGYLCYAFNFCGAVNNNRSDGKTTDMSIVTEQHDLEAVLNLLKQRDDVDTTRISLAGFSQGGMVTVLAAANRAKELASVMLFYPALCIVDDTHAMWTSYDDIPAQHQRGVVLLGACYYQDCWKIDTYAELAKITCPTLLLHGTNDEVVNISYADRASTTLPSVEYHKIQSGHGFWGNAQQQAFSYMLNFIAKDHHLTTSIQKRVMNQMRSKSLAYDLTGRAYTEAKSGGLSIINGEKRIIE